MASLNDIETKVQYIIGLLDARTTKTITGVLPLTFTTTEDKLRDWEIRGNDDVNDDANFFDYVSMTDGVVGKYLISNGTETSNPLWNITKYIPVYGKTFNLSKVGGLTASICFYDSNKNYIVGQQYDTSSIFSKQDITIALSQDVAFARFSYCTAADPIYIDDPATLMLVKGSTAPDHYIPYQQGVGQRTENLWNYTIEQGTILNTGVDEPSDTRVRSVEYIPVEQRQYTIKFDGADEVLIFGFDANKANAQLLYSGWHASAFTFTVAQNIAYIRTVFRFENNANIVPSDVTNIMLVNGSTAPSTYVPYGYEIPLSVNGTPQTFYIGNSPLTAGQSISKTSTGVDIATTEGENTISTTLYNKPEMTIKYK